MKALRDVRYSRQPQMRRQLRASRPQPVLVHEPVSAPVEQLPILTLNFGAAQFQGHHALTMHEWAKGVSIAMLPTEAEIRDKFSRLVSWWRRETFDLSSLTDIITHPAYLRVIGMGESALPLILIELRDRGGWWYAALAAIADDDPVTATETGNTSLMTARWIEWGSKRGLI